MLLLIFLFLLLDLFMLLAPSSLADLVHRQQPALVPARLRASGSKVSLLRKDAGPTVPGSVHTCTAIKWLLLLEPPLHHHGQPNHHARNCIRQQEPPQEHHYRPQHGAAKEDTCCTQRG